MSETNPSSMNVTELQAESARLESLLSETQTALADLQARFGLIRAELARRQAIKAWNRRAALNTGETE